MRQAKLYTLEKLRRRVEEGKSRRVHRTAEKGDSVDGDPNRASYDAGESMVTLQEPSATTLTR